MRVKVGMKAKMWTAVLPCIFALTLPVFADSKSDPMQSEVQGQPTKEELFSAQNIKKLSETYGHLIQKGLDNPVLKLDFDAVVKGMQDGKAGKPSPMSEQEYEVMINQLQEFSYQDLAERNLQEAEKFLKDNAKKDGVKEIEVGKLQYISLKDGTGELVTEDMRPTINYSGQYLDGTVFGSSESGSGPIAISLKQTIPGFRKGILGMKVGEKRRIFIHPELGYGTSGQLLPNALLIFDIEVTDVKPETKSLSANEDNEDGMQMAADNLFPDELDERDELDDYDDEYDSGDEDEAEGDDDSKTASLDFDTEDDFDIASVDRDELKNKAKTREQNSKIDSKKQQPQPQQAPSKESKPLQNQKNSVQARK